MRCRKAYDLCVGDALDLDVVVTDERTVTSSGTQDPDTVTLEISASNSAIKDSIYSVSLAPYHRAKIKFNATSSLIGEHWVEIRATDNHCPTRATSVKRVRIIVHPNPEFDFTVSDVFCGNNEINLNYNGLGSASLRISDSVGQRYYTPNFTSVDYRDYRSIPITYEVEVTSPFGCKSIDQKLVNNQGSAGVQPATLVGPVSYCQGDSTHIALRHDQFGFGDIAWNRSGSIIDMDTLLDHLSFTGRVRLTYHLTHQGNTCEVNEQFDLISHDLPSISTDQIPQLCWSEGAYPLSRINAQPSNGLWTSKDLRIGQNHFYFDHLANEDRSFNLSYEVVEQTTGCTNTTDIPVRLLKSPEMLLSDAVQCGDNFNYRLSNSIILPQHHSPENIQWEVLGQPNGVVGSHPQADLDIKTLGVGIYTVIGTNSNATCVARDTAVITVDEGLVITDNGRTTVCQSEDPIFLTNYLDINAPQGGWTTPDANDYLFLDAFTPKDCGTYHFTYTYDAYGCFAQKDYVIEVVCKPEMNTELPAFVCQNTVPFALQNSALGQWTGPGVSMNTFDPSNLLGKQELKFQSAPVQGCVFEDQYQIEVFKSVELMVEDAPSDLCEGEWLELNIQKGGVSILQVEVCDSTSWTTASGVLTYKPAACDLQKGKIDIQITAKSFETCPSVTWTAEVKYHALPRIETPAFERTCWPYTLHQELRLKTGINPAIDYSISDGSANDHGTGYHIDYAFPGPGSYGLTVDLTDQNGCSNRQDFPQLYQLHPKPHAEFSQELGPVVSLSQSEIALYNHSYLSGEQLNYNWFYMKNGDLNHFSTLSHPVFQLPVDTGRFSIWLEAVSANSCKDTFIMDMRAVPDVIIFIPNAFAPRPGGPDPNNSYKAVSNNVSEYHIQIFNRWGQMVFEAFDIDEGWDGQFLGSECQSGVYIYKIRLKNKSGVPYQYDGTLNLIR